MTFVNAKVCTFDHFFQGSKTLVVDEATTDEELKRYLDSLYHWDNWNPRTLVTRVERMKERKFLAARTALH